MITALAVFLFSLALIMVRPKPLNEATAASLGAFLMVVTGAVPTYQAFEVLKSSANILLFFLGLMIISTLAERGRFFDWSAAGAVRLAGGDGHRLFLIIFFLGAVLTFFFSNDATALILTPIVFAMVTRLKVNPLPYVFICAFIANTASLILPISNPVNLLPVDRFGLATGQYLQFLLAPCLLAIAINIGVFVLVFRKDIPANFEVVRMDKIVIDPFFRFVCAGLAFTAVGYLIALVYGWPLSWPALAGAAVLLIGSLFSHRLDRRVFTRGVSWPILLFVFSLAVLVQGIENAGFTRMLGQALTSLSDKDSFLGIISTTFLTGFGSNLVNNWSMMMVSVSSLASAAPLLNHGMVYSAILGADLGPNITILGSLSSMLWLALLRQRGLDIKPVQYLKIGLLVTPPMLLAGALCVYGVAMLGK